MTEVTDATFTSEVLDAEGVVLVEFWAPWCGPCKQVAPVLEELAAEMDGQVRILKLNTDENPRTTADHHITSVPTLVIFSGGEAVKSLIGARPKATIRAALAEHAAA